MVAMQVLLRRGRKISNISIRFLKGFVREVGRDLPGHF